MCQSFNIDWLMAKEMRFLQNESDFFEFSNFNFAFFASVTDGNPQSAVVSIWEI